MVMQFDSVAADTDPTPYQLAFDGLYAQLRALDVAMFQLDALELKGGGDPVYISNKRIDLRMKSAAKTAEIDRLQSIGEVAAGPRPEDIERLKQAIEALARMNVTAATITAIVGELVTIAGAILYRPKG